MSFTFRQLKAITNRAKNLEDYQYVHLYMIIKNSEYSKNANGIFVNVRKLSNDVVTDIDKYLTMVEKYRITGS